MMHTEYLQRLSERFDGRDVSELQELITEAEFFHRALERLYQKALTITGEEDIPDSMEAWAHDAIFQHAANHWIDDSEPDEPDEEWPETLM